MSKPSFTTIVRRTASIAKKNGFELEADYDNEIVRFINPKESAAEAEEKAFDTWMTRRARSA